MTGEVVREPAGKIVLQNSGTNQNVLVLFQSFKIKWKSSAFVKKILENIETFWFCSKVFRLIGISIGTSLTRALTSAPLLIPTL